MKARNVRFLVGVSVVLIVVLGVGCKLGIGTLCSLGPTGLAYLCPLGFLETALAGRTIFPQVWLPLALVVGSIIVFGRYFCAWICPAALVNSVLHLNGNKSTRLDVTKRSETTFWQRLSDSRYLVLAGTMISSVTFGFPVFCLICPIGLIFGTIFAITRLLSIQQPGLELIIYPTILGLELIAIKNWCRSICPLGALISLISGLNRFFRPVVNQQLCLATKGISCHACERSCPEEIDLRDQKRALNDCTKCFECSDRCPVKAIRFPLRA